MALADLFNGKEEDEDLVKVRNHIEELLSSSQLSFNEKRKIRAEFSNDRAVSKLLGLSNRYERLTNFKLPIESVVDSVFRVITSEPDFIDKKPLSSDDDTLLKLFAKKSNHNTNTFYDNSNLDLLMQLSGLGSIDDVMFCFGRGIYETIVRSEDTFYDQPFSDLHIFSLSYYNNEPGVHNHVADEVHKTIEKMLKVYSPKDIRNKKMLINLEMTTGLFDDLARSYKNGNVPSLLTEKREVLDEMLKHFGTDTYKQIFDISYNGEVKCGVEGYMKRIEEMSVSGHFEPDEIKSLEEAYKFFATLTGYIKNENYEGMLEFIEDKDNEAKLSGVNSIAVLANNSKADLFVKTLLESKELLPETKEIIRRTGADFLQTPDFDEKIFLQTISKSEKTAKAFISQLYKAKPHVDEQADAKTREEKEKEWANEWKKIDAIAEQLTNELGLSHEKKPTFSEMLRDHILTFNVFARQELVDNSRRFPVSKDFKMKSTDIVSISIPNPRNLDVPMIASANAVEITDIHQLDNVLFKEISVANYPSSYSYDIGSGEEFLWHSFRTLAMHFIQTQKYPREKSFDILGDVACAFVGINHQNSDEILNSLCRKLTKEEFDLCVSEYAHFVTSKKNPLHTSSHLHQDRLIHDFLNTGEYPRNVEKMYEEEAETIPDYYITSGIKTEVDEALKWDADHKFVPKAFYDFLKMKTNDFRSAPYNASVYKPDDLVWRLRTLTISLEGKDFAKDQAVPLSMIRTFSKADFDSEIFGGHNDVTVALVDGTKLMAEDIIFSSDHGVQASIFGGNIGDTFKFDSISDTDATFHELTEEEGKPSAYDSYRTRSQVFVPSGAIKYTALVHFVGDNPDERTKQTLQNVQTFAKNEGLPLFVARKSVIDKQLETEEAQKDKDTVKVSGLRFSGKEIIENLTKLTSVRATLNAAISDKLSYGDNKSIK